MMTRKLFRLRQSSIGLAAAALLLASNIASAEVLTGSRARADTVSYAVSDEDRETRATAYEDMPNARVEFSTRRRGVAVIYFQTYLSTDIPPHSPGFQIVVDDSVVFETSRVGNSIFTRFAGIYSNNWLVPDLAAGEHVVKVRWKAGQGFPGDAQGDVAAFESSLIVHHHR